MADDFEIRAFQGQALTRTVTLNPPSAFLGTELLTGSVYYGDTQAAVLTTVPTWTAGQVSGSYDLVDFSLTALQLASIPPGSYAVLIGLAGGTAALAKGFLEVYEAPGGLPTPYYRSLVTPARAQSFLPQISREQLDTLPFALAAATRAIETYVGRPLVLDSYDHIIRPNNSRRLRLRTRPVVELSRVKAGACAAIQLDSGLGTGDQATVRVIPTAPNSLAIDSLVFNSTVAGGTTSQTLMMADYGVIQDLADAINALGNGWMALAYAGTSGLPASEMYGTPGVIGVLGQRPYLMVHTDWLGWQWLDPDQGILEVNQSIPGGFGVPNLRMEVGDSRDRGVRVSYRAGYATAAADIALGYYPVPEDLQSACIMTCNAILETTPMQGPVKSQSVKDRSYVLQDNPSVIPKSCEVILMKYQDVVF